MPHTLDALNSYLRNELSAVDTYALALENVALLGLSALLEQSKQSHIARVTLLRRRIVQLGGHPSESPGAWGLLTEAKRARARLARQVNLSALEEFERVDLKRYGDELIKLDDQTRLLIRDQVLPAQEETYRTIKSIRIARS